MSFGRWLYVAAFALGAVYAIGLGCHSSDGTAPVPPKPPSAVPGHELRLGDDLEPAAPPNSRGLLRLSGSPFEVSIATERDRNRYSIVVLKDGVEFDREVYIDSYEGFRLSEAAGETYEPAIDLLRFPMQVGDTWEWKGQIKLGSDGQDAIAHVETSEETQYVGEVPVKAVKVRVELKFSASPEDMALRTLTFWFAPKRGLFKRQYDTVSIREPNP